LKENRFSYTCILPEEVLTELLKLNIHKSSGLDGISPHILKMSATVIYESFTHIFNISLCTGNFPSKLKQECLDLKPDWSDESVYIWLNIQKYVHKLFFQIT
jgi:hypothetical protein